MFLLISFINFVISLFWDFITGPTVINRRPAAAW